MIDKLIQVMVAVNDMPKAKAFYADNLGLKVTIDYRQDDKNWWVSLTPPEGGVTITLSTLHANLKPGTMTLYFATPDIDVANKDLSAKGLHVNSVKDDLYGPGSGVKWFNLKDPDGNNVYLVQA